MKIALSLSASYPAEPYDFLRHFYVPFFESLGMLPVLIPNVSSDPRAYINRLGLHAIVLTGGGDVDPQRYHQPNTASAYISPHRDSTEFRLLDYAVARQLPVLGICRGMQVINVFFGGGLVQDIPTQLDGAPNHDRDEGTTHPVRLVEPRIVALLGTDTLHVNTYHHQAVTAATLAPGLTAFAVSPADGIVEGVLHAVHPVLGVQWHPERPGPSTPADSLLIQHALRGAFWE